MARQTAFSWQVKPISVDDLDLDEENPRLASAHDHADGGKLPVQQALAKVLWDQMAVDEVALSIAANGFFQEEPLFVIPKAGASNKYIVVEGNRRLAAVRLLRDAALRKAVGAKDLPTISVESRRQLDKLPVSIYETRESLWEYFGFRHINGPQPWDAFAKAKYVVDVHENYKVALKDIARKIGDRHSIVQRLYNGFKVLQQAEKAGFDKDDIVRSRFYFSHLYTAIDYPEFRNFIGVAPTLAELKTNPVPSKNRDDLKSLMLWIYGSKTAGVAPLVQSQNPDLNTLREIVGNKQGVAALRRGVPLSRAFEISIGDERRFRESVAVAKESILQAKGTVTTGYKGQSDLHEMVVDILSVTQSILDEMKPTKSKKR